MNKNKIAKVIINITLITIISVIFVYIVTTYKSQEILLYKYCTIKNYLQKKIGYIGFDKNNTISVHTFLNSKNINNWEKISINKNKDVEYEGKIILTNENIPLNSCSAHTTIEMKILFAAQGVKPREGCDPADIANNGTLGCYIDVENNYSE